MAEDKKHPSTSFPQSVLKPVQDFLMKEQSRLKAQQQQLTREDPFADPSHADDNADQGTDAVEEVGHERVMIIKAEVDKMLINIRKALARIRIGKYGVCANCGRMIDTDRLAVNPMAEHCLDCEKKREHEANHRTGNY